MLAFASDISGSFIHLYECLAEDVDQLCRRARGLGRAVRAGEPAGLGHTLVSSSHRPPLSVFSYPPPPTYSAHGWERIADYD